MDTLDQKAIHGLSAVTSRFPNLEGNSRMSLIDGERLVTSREWENLKPADLAA